MSKKTIPLPTSFWVYLSLTVLCCVLMFVNIRVVIALTGGKELTDFNTDERRIFRCFLIAEALTVVLCFFFAWKSGRLLKAGREAHFAQFRYTGIAPEDDLILWYDFSGYERAQIRERNGLFHLQVEEFDEKYLDGTWRLITVDSIYASLDDVKKALFFDYDFYCEENAELDSCGNEVYKPSEGEGKENEQGE